MVVSVICARQTKLHVRTAVPPVWRRAHYRLQKLSNEDPPPQGRSGAAESWLWPGHDLWPLIQRVASLMMHRHSMCLWTESAVLVRAAGYWQQCSERSRPSEPRRGQRNLKYISSADIGTGLMALWSRLIYCVLTNQSVAKMKTKSANCS